MLSGSLPGIASVLLSALCFYWATYIIRLGLDFEATGGIPYVFSRFLLGYILLEIYALGKKRTPVNIFWLRQRAVWNTIAVFFFFITVEISGVTIANLTNMTYPVFVAVLAPFYIGEKNGWLGITGILVAMFGSLMILIPSNSHNVEDIFIWKNAVGLLSGLTAAIAILALRKIRQSDSTLIILLYTFRIGTLFSLPFALYSLISNSSAYARLEVQLVLWLSALIGFAGQVLLTFGFKYVTAIQGSILSSSRIVMALVFGMLLLSNEVGVYSALGAVAIFIANILVTLDKKNKSAG